MDQFPQTVSVEFGNEPTDLRKVAQNLDPSENLRNQSIAESATPVSTAIPSSTVSIGRIRKA